jgi:transcriptional regulator with XRE-family HTH domain
VTRATRPRRSLSTADRARFAERLNHALKASGLTNAEAARRVRQHLGDGERFSDANLIHYRSGRSVPRLRYLEALSMALDVKPEELITRGTDPLPEPVAIVQDNLGAAEDAPAPAGPLKSDPAAVARSFVVVEDHGSEVHLRLDQRVSWPVALQILGAVKGG